MKPASPIGKGRHEQAATIEAKWLADGIDSVTFKMMVLLKICQLKLQW